MEDVSVADGMLKLTLKLDKEDLSLPFEGAIPKEGDKIRGSVSLQGKVFPAQFEKTTLTSFDPYEQQKEELAKQAGDAEGVRTALELISQAADKKAKPEEVRSWADKAVKWADAYGRRWQREITIEVAEDLAEQEGYGPVALEYARQAEQSLDAEEGLGRRAAARPETLAAALERVGQEGRGQGGRDAAGKDPGRRGAAVSRPQGQERPRGPCGVVHRRPVPAVRHRRPGL